MATQKTKFAVGLFITCGLIMVLLAFVWLGVSRIFETGRYYVAYFDESVQGLDVDSPVKYRGVSIGRVESIEVAPDSRLIQVVLKIETGQQLTEDIVAQLKVAGITGSMFLDLDRKKPDEPDQSPSIEFPSEYPIISSKPSNINELLEGAANALNQISSLDLEGISAKIKLTLDNVNQVIEDADIKGISSNIKLSVDNINNIVDRKNWDGIISSLEDAGTSINEILDHTDGILASLETSVGSLEGIMSQAGNSVARVDNPLSTVERVTVDKEESIKKALDDFRAAMENARAFMEKGILLMDNTDDSISDLSLNLSNTARNLEKASENINRLIEEVSEQPSRLIFRDPPPERETEP